MSKLKYYNSYVNKETKKVINSSIKKEIISGDYVILHKDMITALNEDGIHNVNCILLLAKIISFSSKGKKCVVLNKYFSDFFGVHERTVQKWLSELKKKEYIKIHETKIMIDGEFKTVRREIIPLDKIYKKIGKDRKWN